MTESRPVHSTATPPRAVAPEDADLVDCPLATLDGKPIMVVERGLAPHPHPSQEGKLVPFKFLQRIQLADESIRYRCANFRNGTDGERCWRDDFTNPRAASAHINSHGQTREPEYPEETLRTVIRLVRTFQKAGKRNYAQLTAEQLNLRGVPTHRAERWTNEQVSALFNQYKDKFRTYVRDSELLRLNPELLRLNPELAVTTRAVPVSPAAPSAPVAAAHRPATPQEIPVTVPAAPPGRPLAATGDASLAALDQTSAQLLRDATELFTRQKAFAENLAAFAEQIGTKLTELAAASTTRQELDAETLDAARRWRDMMQIMGR